MGYPQQPQDPYGQSGPQYPSQQQPYGYSGPQPAGYGYQPPTGPPPPPRRNVGMILLLAVGLPLLLLGGCGALVLVLADAGRDRVVTEADAPIATVPSGDASAAPPVEQPKEEAEQEDATAAIGGSITLEGTDPGLKMKVTVVKLVDPGTPAEDFLKPQTGNKFVAVQVTLANVGRAVYSDSPTNGAVLIDGEGQQFRATIYDVREGQSFGGSATIGVGDSRKGVIVFEVPEGAKLAKFQFALNSGFADHKGEWALS